MSYGYSELENNNQMSLTSSMVGDMSLQTPNVEYSSTSIKKEILVSEWRESLLKPHCDTSDSWRGRGGWESDQTEDGGQRSGYGWYLSHGLRTVRHWHHWYHWHVTINQTSCAFCFNTCNSTRLDQILTSLFWFISSDSSSVFSNKLPV